MEEYELNALLEEIESAGGSGTWHVSLYIRPDKSIQHEQNRIKQEQSEAESIKSDSTRDRVQSALQKMYDALQQYKTTPENGMVVFASPNEVHVLDNLPFEVSQNLYHCDSSFKVDILKGDFEVGGTYGLIVIERGEAAVGVLSRGRITDVTTKQSQVMGKTRAGGQSAQRFARIREKQKQQFYKKVASMARGLFTDVDGVLLGGTLSSAKEFEDYLWHDVNLLGTYSVEYANEQGLEQLVQKGSSQLESESEKESRAAVEEFLKGLRTGDSEYGREAVVQAIEQGAVKTLLLSTRLDIDDIKSLSESAEQMGGEVVVVEPSFENAHMFQELGGYGAILRYQI